MVAETPFSNLTVLLPLDSPAREQLRRSRHSRTFLVESGVGELWAELQAGGETGSWWDMSWDLEAPIH